MMLFVCCAAILAVAGASGFLHAGCGTWPMSCFVRVGNAASGREIADFFALYSPTFWGVTRCFRPYFVVAPVRRTSLIALLSSPSTEKIMTFPFPMRGDFTRPCRPPCVMFCTSQSRPIAPMSCFVRVRKRQNTSFLPPGGGNDCFTPYFL